MKSVCLDGNRPQDILNLSLHQETLDRHLFHGDIFEDFKNL